MPDEIFFSSLRLEACDMDKISSGAALCPAISPALQVEFKAAVRRGNQNWCSVTEKTRISAKITLSRSLWQTTLSSSGLVTCDKDQISFRQVALWHVTDELIEIVQYSWKLTLGLPIILYPRVPNFASLWQTVFTVSCPSLHVARRSASPYSFLQSRSNNFVF